jgi:hypothetical protein
VEGCGVGFCYTGTIRQPPREQAPCHDTSEFRERAEKHQKVPESGTYLFQVKLYCLLETHRIITEKTD